VPLLADGKGVKKMKNLVILIMIVFAAGAISVQTGCKMKNKVAKTVVASENPNGQSDKPIVESKPEAETPSAEIAIDQTSSSDLSVLNPSAENLRKSVENSQISKVAAVRLGEGGKISWAANLQNFNLPLIPTETFDASAAENSMAQRCRAKLKCREERLEKMRKDFEIMQADKIKTAQTERGEQSHQIVDFITAPTKGSAECTDLINFRDRLISDGFKRVIFYTDGDHECPTPITTKRFAPDAKVIVLQMPLKGENSGAAFTERTKVLEQIFTGDGVTVMPVVSADREVFDKFLR